MKPAKNSFPPKPTDSVFIRAHRAHQTKLSYFFGCIDFAPCDGEIDHLSAIDRVAQKKLERHGCIKKASLRAPNKKSEEPSMTHKLNSPQEWLLEKAQHWNTDTLYKALSGLAYRLDGQSIRDLFYSEMDSDGYFDKKTKPNADAFDAESWGSHRWHT